MPLAGRTLLEGRAEYVESVEFIHGTRSIDEFLPGHGIQHIGVGRCHGDKASSLWIINGAEPSHNHTAFRPTATTEYDGIGLDIGSALVDFR